MAHSFRLGVGDPSADAVPDGSTELILGLWLGGDRESVSGEADSGEGELDAGFWDDGGPDDGFWDEGGAED
ncbi:MAG: hypothetical protein Q3997_01735, partial [Propionibacteriaceae bacterium]|nr:hypothetical protein [Propionibacteriaceae bacterium]